MASADQSLGAHGRGKGGKDLAPGCSGAARRCPIAGPAAPGLDPASLRNGPRPLPGGAALTGSCPSYCAPGPQPGQRRGPENVVSGNLHRSPAAAPNPGRLYLPATKEASESSPSLCSPRGLSLQRAASQIAGDGPWRFSHECPTEWSPRMTKVNHRLPHVGLRNQVRSRPSGRPCQRGPEKTGEKSRIKGQFRGKH